MSSSSFNPGFVILDPFSNVVPQSALLVGINQDVDRFQGEIDALFQESATTSSSSDSVTDVNSRLDDLIVAVKQLGARALSELKFMPEKVKAFEGRLSVVQSEWDLVGRDSQFQNSFHRFYLLVQRLSVKRQLTEGEGVLLQNSFSTLSLQEQSNLAPLLGLATAGSSSSSTTSQGGWADLKPAALVALMGKLDTVYLPQRMTQLPSEKRALFDLHVEKFAHVDGGLAENSMRLVKAFSQLTLSERNAVMIQLWKELVPICPKSVIIRLLSHSPLLENVRNGTDLQLPSSVVEMLKERALLSIRFSDIQAKLEVRYSFLKAVFEDSSNPITKGMNEKRMQVILSSDISKLESYFNILQDLCEQQLPPVDVQYLLEVIHNQFAQKPVQGVLEKECALMELRKLASRAIRERTFAEGWGLAYKTIFLVGSKENPFIGSKKDPLGKYKPLDSRLALMEKLGESYNALLGTDFAPPADGVVLSIKKELEIIQAYFKSSREQEALERFTQLPVRVKNSIFHKLNVFKEGSESNSPSAWISGSTEDRLRAIQIYLERGAYERFKKENLKERKFSYGTLQCWVDGCYDARKLLREDPNAGQKISRIPVTIVQLYTILGLVKGCRDGHESNTLFKLNEQDEIAQLVDCDDEHIMPSENTYQNIRMWSLGFPQAAQPLSRPLMRMLAAPNFLEHFRLHNLKEKHPEDIIYERQEQRLLHMQMLCQAALSDPTKSLTVQDLYFELFGGREKYTELLTGGELYKKMLRDVGMAEPNDPNPPSPAIIFDHFMVNTIRPDYKVVRQETVDHPMFQQNLRALYSGARSSSSSAT